MAATVVWGYQSDTNLTTAVEAYGGTNHVWDRTWFNSNAPVTAANTAKPIEPKPRLCTWPFPAPTDLVAGPARVALVKSQAVRRRPVVRALRGGDPRPLRARPGRRGVLRRKAEQNQRAAM